MITLSDSLNTIESKNFFVILPSITHNINKYLKRFKAHKVKKQFSYNSLENSNKLSINILKNLFMQSLINKKNILIFFFIS